MKLFLISSILLISLGFVKFIKLQDKEVVQLSKELFSSQKFKENFPQKIDTIYVSAKLKTNYKSFTNDKETILFFYTKESLFVEHTQEWFEINDLREKDNKFYFNLLKRKFGVCKECPNFKFRVIMDKNFNIKKMKKYK